MNQKPDPTNPTFIPKPFSEAWLDQWYGRMDKVMAKRRPNRPIEVKPLGPAAAFVRDMRRKLP